MSHSCVFTAIRSQPNCGLQRSYPPPEEIATPANAELLIDDVLNPQQAESQRQVWTEIYVMWQQLTQFTLHVRAIHCAVQVASEQPDTRDWRSRSQAAAQPGDGQIKAPQTEAKPQAQAQAPQAAAQAPQRQKPSAQQQASGAAAKETVSCTIWSSHTGFTACVPASKQSHDKCCNLIGFK